MPERDLDDIIANAQANGRPLTPQEIEALQVAASSIGTGIQRGLSVVTFLTGLGCGTLLGYLIWGGKK